MPADFDWQAYEAEITDLSAMADSILPDSVPVPAEPAPPDARSERDPPAMVDGAVILAELHAVLCRYLIMPSPEATDAVVLWIAATHAQPAWEHATRLVVTGPAKRCGKSRLLEIIKEIAHRTMPCVNASTAALYRSIDSDDPPTILYDEADTKFGNKRAAESNDDLRALLNAGHSRGWPIWRCVGPNQEVKAFSSFAMAAIAGIGQMPDTITDRAVNIRMRRRNPDTEKVDPYRMMRDGKPLRPFRDRLRQWIRAHLNELRDATPDMPVEDRAADTWESLIAVADLAGDDWPQRARKACTTLVKAAAEADTESSDSLRLLADLRTIFGEAGKLYTTTIIDRLRTLEDGGWSDLTVRQLSRMLRDYGIRPKSVRETGTGASLRGYDLADLTDAFTRYLPVPVADVVDTETHPPHAVPTLTSDVVDVVDVVAPPLPHEPDDATTPPNHDPPTEEPPGADPLKSP